MPELRKEKIRVVPYNIDELKDKDLQYFEDEFEICIGEIIGNSLDKLNKKREKYDTYLEYYKNEEPDQLRYLACHYIRVTVTDKMIWLDDESPPTWKSVVQSAASILCLTRLCNNWDEAKEKATRLVAVAIAESEWHMRMRDVSTENFKSIGHKLLSYLEGYDTTYYGKWKPSNYERLNTLVSKDLTNSEE